MKIRGRKLLVAMLVLILMVPSIPIDAIAEMIPDTTNIYILKIFPIQI